jgi:hypothetical protein
MVDVDLTGIVDREAKPHSVLHGLEVVHFVEAEGVFLNLQDKGTSKGNE